MELKEFFLLVAQSPRLASKVEIGLQGRCHKSRHGFYYSRDHVLIPILRYGAGKDNNFIFFGVGGDVYKRQAFAGTAGVSFR